MDYSYLFSNIENEERAQIVDIGELYLTKSGTKKTELTSVAVVLLFQLFVMIGTFIRGGHVMAFFALFTITDVLLMVYLIGDELRIKGLIWSLFSVASICIDLRIKETEEVSETWILCDNQFVVPVLLCSFYFLFRHIYSKTIQIRADHRGRLIICLLSVFFSAFSLLGYSYQEIDSWDLIFANSTQMSKAYIVFIGFYLMFYYIIAYFYSIVDRITDHSASKPELSLPHMLQRPFEWYTLNLHERPFNTSFVTLIIFHFPYMLTAYPCIFAGDTIDQILQAFQIPYNSAVSTDLISDLQLINQHHSVFHTMIMHYMLCFGVNVFHSANIGLFLVALIQTLLTFCAISYLIKTLVSEKIPDAYLLILLGYYVLQPRIQNMLFVLSKDVLYGAVTLISIVQLWKVISGRQSTKATRPIYILSLILMEILRKEGVYIIILQLIILMVAEKKNRKLWIGAILSVVSINMLLGRIIYPSLLISPSPINEALSIPIQQTARYLQEYPDDVSDMERRAIDKMWDYDELKENYDPNRSDIAKATFRKKSVKSDWIDYFEAWISMLQKHPTVYIQATLNNYYEYYFPGIALADAHTFERRAWDIDYVNEKLGDKGIMIYYPKRLDKLRFFWETTRERTFSLPILSIFLSVAVYAWILLGSLFYWIYRRNMLSALMHIPILLILMVCLAGPCNGSYFRYFYPIVLCLPASMSLAGVNDGREQ